MGADATPDDVRRATLDLVSVLEGGAAVRRPSHLPDTWVSLDPLDTQARVEDAGPETRDKEIQRPLPCRNLRRGQALEVTQEPGRAW